jgi:hypothetical protein
MRLAICEGGSNPLAPTTFPSHVRRSDRTVLQRVRVKFSSVAPTYLSA